MPIEAGDAFAIKINAHRQSWNGAICVRPIEWSCGTAPKFRESHCATGRENCFHLNVFADIQRRVLTPELSVQTLLAENPDILDDQILFFYGTRFEPQRGVSQMLQDQVIYGAYRVKSARIENIAGLRQVVIEPYSDGWAIFPRNKVRKGRSPSAFDGVSYLAYTRHEKIYEYFETALDEAQRAIGIEQLTDDHMARLVHFNTNLEAWMGVATSKLSDNLTEPGVPKGRVAVPLVSYSSSGTPRAETKLQNFLASALASGNLRPAPAPVIEYDENPENAVVALAPPDTTTLTLVQALPIAEQMEAVLDADFLSQPGSGDSASIRRPSDKWKRPMLPEKGQESLLERQYGKRTMTSLRIATITKPMLLLAGGPGVGKSYLAPRLLNDPERARTVIVPVSSNWRGRDDLLGYVNPVSGEFEPTEFTKFLLRAQQAWNAGDERIQVAIFEEFNLSPPEHWLSDLLVRMEYGPSLIKDRTLHLGGSRITGEDPSMPTSVYLPPTLLMVGTLNNDHTVRKLSPRVMDRAALVEISSTARAALARAGVTTLQEEAVDAIEDLNGLLEPLGVAFSVRSAISLRDSVSLLGQAETLDILDHVLAQEVLSKVRLNAGDMHDESIVSKLIEWTGRRACEHLSLCREKITSWQAHLQRGRDVFQA